MKGVQIIKSQIILDDALTDQLKILGTNLQWKVLLEMELLKPFRKENRSLEDILYLKETYTSKKPLLTLQKTKKTIEQESHILRSKTSHFIQHIKGR